jgi:histidine triad (HIT) family protein
MTTIFTRIIEGELPARFVWKDERVVAFLSINPLKEGHTLVVPREEVDHWLDASSDIRTHLFEVCHAVGQALERAYSPKKVGLMIAGLEVPHLHVHVVPIEGVHDLHVDVADEAIDVRQAAAFDERRARCE